MDSHGAVGGGLWWPESETGVLDGGGEESVGVGNFRASRDDSAGGEAEGEVAELVAVASWLRAAGDGGVRDGSGGGHGGQGLG